MEAARERSCCIVSVGAVDAGTLQPRRSREAELGGGGGKPGLCREAEKQSSSVRAGKHRRRDAELIGFSGEAELTGLSREAELAEEQN